MKVYIFLKKLWFYIEELYTISILVALIYFFIIILVFISYLQRLFDKLSYNATSKYVNILLI